MTTAPGLTQSPRIICGRPTAATSTSACAAHRRKIARARVGDGHRGVRGEQELRHRLADDVAPPDDDGVRAVELRVGDGEQPHAPDGVHATSAPGGRARAARR